jgi:signal transduction histidine kinase
MTSLLGQIADASSLATASSELPLTRFAPAAILRREFERQTQETPHYVWTFACDVDAPILGDPTAIERVFRMLLKNAAQFSAKDTSIVITGALHGGGIEFTFADQGIGIPHVEQPRVFDLFFRASNASTQSAQGLGLGLFIARSLIQSHQGRLLLESEVGRGSTFRVWLPIAPPAD